MFLVSFISLVGLGLCLCAF